jgi:hypothetical protein
VPLFNIEEYLSYERYRLFHTYIQKKELVISTKESIFKRNEYYNVTFNKIEVDYFIIRDYFEVINNRINILLLTMNK